MKLIDRGKLWHWIGWLSLFGTAGLLASLVITNYPSFWRSAAWIRLFVFMAAFSIFSIILRLGLLRLFQQLSNSPPADAIFPITLAILTTAILWVLNWRLTVSVPSIAFNGSGALIEKWIDAAIAFILLPLLFTLLYYELHRSWIQVRSIFLESVNAPAWANRQLYHKIFIMVCIAAFLAPWYGVTDFQKLEKNFWGRGWLLRAYSSVCVFMHNQVFDSSLIGPNNWLILADTASMDDFQNTMPYSERDLAAIQRKLDGLATRLAVKGVKKLIVIIPPNKNTIYPEYLPPQIPMIGGESRLDQLVNYEKQHGQVKVLDFRPTFFAAKADDSSLLYYRTDTHWNSLGAFIAYQEIMKEVQTVYPDDEPMQTGDFKIISTQIIGSIGPTMIRADFPETALVMSPAVPLKLITQNWWTNPAVPTLTSTVRIVVNPDPTLPRLVMFRDSFTILLEPLLTHNFGRSVFIWSPPNDETYYDSEKPDVVIIECTERYLDALFNIPD